MGAKETFQKQKAKFLAWYRERVTRRVFVIACLLAVVCLIVSAIPGLNIIYLAGVCCVIVAVGASFGDTITSRKEFIAMTKRLEHEHRIRQSEAYGYVREPSCFSDKDKANIKRKLTGFKISFVFKTIFLIILIALLFQGGV
jgi:hypothetical protein